MDSFLKDLSQPALAGAVRANLYAYFRLLGKSARADFWEGQGLARWRTGVPHPWFNGVLAGSPPDAGASQTVAQTRAYFQDHQVQAFTWWLDLPLEPPAWQPVLEAAGLHLDRDTPGMALDLETLPAPAGLAPGVTIRPVEDLAGLAEWVNVFLAGYGLPEEWAPAFYGLLESLGVELPQRYYLGTLAGRPVATATLFLGGGAAGVYNIATLPEARQRGLGRLLTLAPLLEARQLGCRVGVLQSSEMGFGVYRRLGFQQVCTMDHFYGS